MQIKTFNTRLQMGQAAAKAVTETIRQLLSQQKEVNIIFAAAPSQNEFLVDLLTEQVEWNRINAFHMDEYIGLDMDDEQSFARFLYTHLFSLVPLKSVHYLNGRAADDKAECNRYEELLKTFPTDIVCMGIGENCHIAFNDPPVADFNDPFTVKKVELEQSCRQQQVNDGCFASLDKVPEYALTLTVPALMQAPHIFVIVPGDRKALAVYHTLNSPIDELHPSTILRQHANVQLFLDKNSSALYEAEEKDIR
jgi:glucosamine-6-phosphate deaminase